VTALHARARGTVVATRGNIIEAQLPFARIGAGVRIGARLCGRVIALHDGRALVAPFGALEGVAAGTIVAHEPLAVQPVLGSALLGRAVTANGEPLDGRPRVRAARSASHEHHGAARRRALHEICWTGVRAIDGPLAFARGARIGLFGAAGAGKSTLLDQIVRGVDADAVVVGLVGERGREAERCIAALDTRTTIVCATADRSAAERVRAAEVAVEHADALRARGLDVLLVLDSLARTCAAQRELALAVGEPVGRAGYPPSVFALMARLLERGGAFHVGSLTIVATVLSDGPDAHDPVGEAARAALDGHLVLGERLARAGRFPAVDHAQSVSRTLGEVADPRHRASADVLRAAIVSLESSAEARALGLDPAAGDPFLARALAAEPAIRAYLRQTAEPSAPAATLTELHALADRMR
jgi:FliI/YscN family ATPase